MTRHGFFVNFVLLDMIPGDGACTVTSWRYSERRPRPALVGLSLRSYTIIIIFDNSTVYFPRSSLHDIQKLPFVGVSSEPNYTITPPPYVSVHPL